MEDNMIIKTAVRYQDGTTQTIMVDNVESAEDARQSVHNYFAGQLRVILALVPTQETSDEIKALYRVTKAVEDIDRLLAVMTIDMRTLLIHALRAKGIPAELGGIGEELAAEGFATYVPDRDGPSWAFNLEALQKLDAVNLIGLYAML